MNSPVSKHSEAPARKTSKHVSLTDLNNSTVTDEGKAYNNWNTHALFFSWVDVCLFVWALGWYWLLKCLSKSSDSIHKNNLSPMALWHCNWSFNQNDLIFVWQASSHFGITISSGTNESSFITALTDVGELALFFKALVLYCTHRLS